MTHERAFGCISHQRAGGAEISGVDVAQDLDQGTVAEIREALNEHCVVFFRLP